MAFDPADMEQLMAAIFFGEDRAGDRVYIFHRSDMFYPIALRDDADAIENAHHNPGTTKVTNWDGSRVIWAPGAAS